MKRERLARSTRGEATDMMRTGFDPEWVTPTGEESDSFVKAGGLDKIMAQLDSEEINESEWELEAPEAEAEAEGEAEGEEEDEVELDL
jgi:hypothetical protein